jgi:hypothetical protein
MMYVGGICVHVEVGNRAVRAGNKVFFVNAPIWGGGRDDHLPVFLGFPLLNANVNRV